MLPDPEINMNKSSVFIYFASLYCQTGYIHLYLIDFLVLSELYPIDPVVWIDESTHSNLDFKSLLSLIDSNSFRFSFTSFLRCLSAFKFFRK